MERARKRIDTSDNFEGTSSINYSGQGWYRRSKSNYRNKPKADPLSVMGCFNCDNRGPRAKDCQKPNDFAKAATRKIEYLIKTKTKNAVYVVLAFRCEQLENHEYYGGGNDNACNDDDGSIFNSICETGTADIYPMRVEDTVPGPDVRSKSDEDVVHTFSVQTTPPNYVEKNS